MKTKNFFKLCILSLSIISCAEDRLNTESQSQQEIIQDAQVKNGRLYFPNKSSLQFYYNNLKNASEEEIANYVDSKNYLPLRPILTEKNENLVAQKLSARINKFKEKAKLSKSAKISNYLSRTTSNEEIIDDIDDLEEIIGDDAYGAFLNNEAEIQVANEIYKYTDVGLFIVDENNYPTLEPYLESKNISTNLIVPTEENVRQQYIEERPCNQLSLIPSTEIEYFNSYECGGYSGGGSGGGTTYNPPIVDPNIQMMNFINGLQHCDIKHGLFGNLFGENDVCIDRYEDRYRVKTKAFNYNYLLVYHLGVKVKHQYKGWTGLWRKENCQEIRLGVQGVQFQYDYSSFFVPQTINYGKTNIYTKTNRYMYDATTFWNPNQYGIYEMTGFNMESFPRLMQDDIVIENFGYNNTADIVGFALSQANRQLTSDNLNKLFWESSIKELKDFWIKIGTSAPVTDNKITLFRKYPDFGKVLIHKTFYEHKYNDDKAEKTFDFGGEIKLNIDPNSGQINSVSPGTTIKKPQDFMVKMYGIAKRNGQWHGSKIDNTK